MDNVYRPIVEHRRWKVLTSEMLWSRQVAENVFRASSRVVLRRCCCCVRLRDRHCKIDAVSERSWQVVRAARITRCRCRHALLLYGCCAAMLSWPTPPPSRRYSDRTRIGHSRTSASLQCSNCISIILYRWRHLLYALVIYKMMFYVLTYLLIIYLLTTCITGPDTAAELRWVIFTSSLVPHSHTTASSSQNSLKLILYEGATLTVRWGSSRARLILINR